jgi:hypothetical protein
MAPVYAFYFAFPPAHLANELRLDNFVFLSNLDRNTKLSKRTLCSPYPFYVNFSWRSNNGFRSERISSIGHFPKLYSLDIKRSHFLSRLARRFSNFYNPMYIFVISDHTA